MTAPIDKTDIVGGLDSVNEKVAPTPSNDSIHEKNHVSVDETESDKDGVLVTETKAVRSPDDSGSIDSRDVIIVSGTDVAVHLLSLRDDGEPSLSFRSIFLGTCLSAFQTVMSQIYNVSLNVVHVQYKLTAPSV
jgi:hypothetical protein